MKIYVASIALLVIYFGLSHITQKEVELNIIMVVSIYILNELTKLNNKP